MKKTLLSAGLLWALGAQAQIEKKDVLLGGSFGFNSNSSSPNNSSSSNTNLNPTLEWAFKKNNTVGVMLGFSYSRQKNDVDSGEQITTVQTYSPSIQFTQYFPLKNRFGWHLRESAGYTYNKNKSTGGGVVSAYSNQGFSLNVLPGIHYVAGEKQNWLLHANVGGIGMNYMQQKHNNGSVSFKTDQLGFRLTAFQSFQFGFAYIFRK